MCGILGIARPRPLRVELTDAQLVAMRDTLAHRGPDSAGLWRSEQGHVALAHRRLAVVDLTAEASQPMLAYDRQGSVAAAVVYNGELYNDAELRAHAAQEGWSGCGTRAGQGAPGRFVTQSDTETVLALLSQAAARAHRCSPGEADAWTDAIAGALATMRGMFALGFLDSAGQRLVIARDSLGIKPLYYSVIDDEAGRASELVFASEARAILAHPRTRARPDLVTVSSYLTTIRTTLGERTLFSGVRTLRPGEMAVIDLRSPGAFGVEVRDWTARLHGARNQLGCGATEDVLRGRSLDLEATRRVLADSVSRHLRADRPTCVLLSGGLDSSIIALEASRARSGGAGPLRTYASGFDDGTDGTDLGWARRMSAALGTAHTQCPVTREMFEHRWREMVEHLGVPLSTPNEVAINEVSRRLRSDGHVVALSGEGADELFGGYELPMRQAAEFERQGARSDVERGVFQLVSNAWVAPAHKAEVFKSEVWRALEQDAALHAEYVEAFERVAASAGRTGAAEALELHLRFTRRVNLTGLLGRLDTASMLEGVEGRTPMADARVALMADAIPMRFKYELGASPGESGRTKIALRDAYRGLLPDEIIDRPKASFPLPFQEWMQDAASVLVDSAFAREVFAPGAISLVAQSPRNAWHLAWPMINIALWARVWWG